MEWYCLISNLENRPPLSNRTIPSRRPLACQSCNSSTRHQAHFVPISQAKISLLPCTFQYGQQLRKLPKIRRSCDGWLEDLRPENSVLTRTQ